MEYHIKWIIMNSKFGFISYLLRFSDTIDRMKNSYITIANRLSHTWEKPLHPIRNQLSELIGQFANAFTLFVGASSISIQSSL